MPKISYAKAAADAVAEEMRADPKVFHLSTDAPQSLLKEFGPSRVRETPITESALTGIAIGAVLALAATRFLGTLLFGVEAFDAGTYLGVSAVMVLVGLAASYLPARRASKVDPLVSLRSE